MDRDFEVEFTALISRSTDYCKQGKYKESMLYCRHATECIIENQYLIQHGQDPVENHDRFRRIMKAIKNTNVRENTLRKVLR